MRNIEMVYKNYRRQENEWLCKCDAVAWLVMVVSTWALLGKYGFSHILALYCRQI